MQKLIDTLKSFGIEIPEDKQADVKKALSEHYKNAKEVAKTLSKVEGERDDWKERAETAEETLKGLTASTRRTFRQSLLDGRRKLRTQRKNSMRRSPKEILTMLLKLHWKMLIFHLQQLKDLLPLISNQLVLSLRTERFLDLMIYLNR